MRVSGHSRRTVLLLGAGATRGAFKHVVYRRKRLRAPLNGDFFDVARTFARAHGENSAEARRLQRVLRFFRDSVPIHGTPAMEEAFSVLYLAKDLQRVYRSGPGRARKPGSLREIDDFLYLTHRILHALNTNQPTGYDRLVSRLEPHDTVITLNYDTLLDSALHRSGWDPRTGYGLSGDKRKIRWSARTNVQQLPLRQVKLLKLHGSLNWFVRGSTERLQDVFDKKPTLVSTPGKNSRGGYVRQIVPPIYGKTFRHAHWAQLWKAAFDACVQADALVVIGCSLVDTDFHLRAFVSRVASIRKRGAKLRYLLLADRARVRRKWVAAMKGAYTSKHYSTTFEDFLRKEGA